LLESDEEVRILMDLPGLKKEDLDIQLKDAKTVIIRGERKMPAIDAEKVSARRLERASGHFARAFFLPYEVTAESITASFHDGVLEVALRKPESIKPRKIEISVE
jgi:HSP20 family protein